MFRIDLLSLIRSLNTPQKLVFVKFVKAQQAKRHINIKTQKKNCIKPTQQYGITKYAEKTASNITNASCCELILKNPDDGQKVCPKHVEFFIKIK